jgi:uncharacterized protein YciI
VKYVVRYETDPAGYARAGELFPAHRAHWNEFLADGTLLAIGPMAEPRHGAMGVFTTRAAAEAFATGDPFVTEGLIASWEILEWNEVLLPDAPAE